jgi:hypothetical protein
VDATAILIGIGIFVAIVLVAALVVRIVFMRSALSAAVSETRRMLKARDAYVKVYGFTASTPAQRIIEAIEKRYGRAVPDASSGFYVVSTIYEQQVILAYGNRHTPRIFIARIDFDTRDPASGAMWFSEADVYSPGTEAAQELHSELAQILDELSPGSVLEERKDGVIATWTPPEGMRHPPGKPRHRK